MSINKENESNKPRPSSSSSSRRPARARSADMRNKEAAPAASTTSKTGDKEAATPTRRKKVLNAGSVKAVPDAVALPTGSVQSIHQMELVKADSVESESLKTYIDSEPADDDVDVLPTLPAFPG